MTDEQRQKLHEINEAVSPLFAQIHMLDEQIRRYEQLIAESRTKRAEIKAELDAWEQKYMDTWQEFFSAREAR